LTHAQVALAALVAGCAESLRVGQGLDQAAERLNKAALDQLELHLRAGQLVQDWKAAPNLPERDPNQKSRPAVLGELPAVNVCIPAQLANSPALAPKVTFGPSNRH
jgi:hypothetical protein